MAVILMLFSPQARVNGPLFLVGWALALALVSGVTSGSVTIAAPVAYFMFGGAGAKLRLDSLKGWLGLHNAAVMAVLFLVLGVTMVGQGLAPLLS